MEALKTVIWIVNIFSSLAIIGLVLMQHGKGADAGASFGGSGSAQGVFGSGGNANFLSRMTGISAIVFFSTCLALGYIHTNGSKSSLNFDDVSQTAPAVTGLAAASIPAVGAASQTPAPASGAVETDSTDSSGIQSAAAVAAAGAAGAVAAKALNHDAATESKPEKPKAVAEKNLSSKEKDKTKTKRKSKKDASKK